MSDSTVIKIQDYVFENSEYSNTDDNDESKFDNMTYFERLKNCYFMSGFLNGDMFGGVFRSGKLGPYATLSSDTKVVSDVETFFHEKPEEEMGKSYKKGGIKDLKNITK